MMGIPVVVGDPGYIECTYNVLAAGKQSIMYSNFSMLSAIVGMEVDGVPVPVDKSYQFETAGEHVIRFYVPQLFEMYQMFSGVNILTGVAFHINPLVRVLLFRTFYSCTELRSVDFGDSYVWCDTMESMFAQCTKSLTVDISKIHLLPKKVMAANNAFYNANIYEIVFGEVDAMSMNQTFWGLKSNTTLIDFTRVKAITASSDAFINAYKPDKIDFGYCDLSGIGLTVNLFMDFYGKTSKGSITMLGKPYKFTKWWSKQFGFGGTLIYNLEHDYSDIIESEYQATAQALSPVEKTLRVRFCTNDAWVTDPSAEFVINGVRGAYVSQGIWVFGMTAETYKYPVFYNGAEIGEAIVKDDVQNIAFGTNDAVYKAIDFLEEDTYDPSIIVANDGWTLIPYSQTASYYGLRSPDIAVGEKTSVTINTGMSGDIRLTLYQDSQPYYHYGRIYNSAGVELKNMYGNLCQSSYIVGNVQSDDGILTFTYDKSNSASEYGADRMSIKKIESYNWPAIPAE